MSFYVIGAGLAGLFASAVLQHDCLEVLERQPEVPNNHHAILRFRTGVFGDAVNIPFNKVPVLKSYVPFVGNIVGDSISYSLKTNGSATLRSSISADGKVVDRYIAPTDLVNQLVRRVGNKVAFEYAFGTSDLGSDRKYISTMPMPVLMDILGYEDRPKFESVAGYVVTAKLTNCSVYATLYLPDPHDRCYRVSITGDQFIAEYVDPPMGTAANEIRRLSRYFGLNNLVDIADEPMVHMQRYAKILPINERQRKTFMAWATDEHNIYSFGRFATWRPSLQLDDLVNDLKRIQEFARSGPYERRKANA